MNEPNPPATPRADTDVPPTAAPPLLVNLIRLARPAQWAKSAFVLIGPFYALKDMAPGQGAVAQVLVPAFIAAAAFALASSGCYVVNDIVDREADRAHPRKRLRPIAAGLISLGVARAFAAVLLAASAALLFALPAAGRPFVALCLSLYVGNVLLYSAYLKHKVIADVMSLSLGFVLRVMGGCAAAVIEPSVWLLNVTFFLSMFLAFGKRLGERRTLSETATQNGASASDTSRAILHRRVQAGYTDALLQMAVVVTAVITLMTYALYVKDQGDRYTKGFNLLWLTMLPATYGLLRGIVMLERGRFDDPTELALHDRGFQAAGLAFLGLTLGLMWWAGRGALAGTP